jgi:hypothetical protein
MKPPESSSARKEIGHPHLQGMGNLANALVILISMAFFNQTGVNLTFTGSRNVLALQYGVGAFFCLVMVCYRFVFLEESQVRGLE